MIAILRGDGVYVINPDGSNVRVLWRGEWVFDVAWSPDGRKLAFGTLAGIRVMNSDGSGLTRVAGVPASSLSWSPDGRRIAFSGWSRGSDLWIINADGSKLRQLTRTPKIGETNVDWSPAGDRLAFDRAYPWPPHIYVIKTDGSGLRDLGPTPWIVRHRPYCWSTTPDWSPDGRRIAFSYHEVYSYGEGDIWVMNANGKALVKLTQNQFITDSSPAWSPDGRRIAFVRYKGSEDNGTIIVMNADGSGQTALTQTGFGGHNPAWQPLAAS